MLLKMLQEEFVMNCQCRNLSPKTITNYKKQVSYLLEFLEREFKVTELDAVAPHQIKQFMIVMQKRGRKPSYINDLLKAFKCFFKYIQEEEYIPALLTAKIKNVKQPKVIIKTFTNEEVKGMLDCYQGHSYLAMRNKAIMAMFFDTGIRLNELITLKQEQIYPDYLLIKGKGNKERVVPKSPYLAKILMKYQVVRDGYFAYRVIPYDNLFLSKNCKPLTAEAVARVVKLAGAYAGVGEEIRCSPHTCRHTFAQMQLRNGLDVYSLSRLMGHESISITQRYLEGIRDKEVIRAGTRTSPLMNL